MTNKVTLFQQALASAGTRTSISDPKENSIEAEKCRLFYDTTRREVLSMAHWPSAKKNVRLTRYSTRDVNADWKPGDPAPQFEFAYILPPDMVHPRFLDGFEPFDIQLIEDDRKALMTDAEAPVLEYTKDQTNIAIWDPVLFLAMVEALASKIALPLTGKRQNYVDAIDRADNQINDARAAVANYVQEEYDQPAEWISARNGVGGRPTSRYIYPLKAAFVVSMATPTVRGRIG